MKKNFLKTLSLASLLAFLVAMPVGAAQEVKFSVNGEQAVVNSYLENGVTMIGVDSFARITGATWEESADAVKIVKNGKALILTVGKKNASLDGSSYSLAKAPEKVQEQLYIPLRSVSQALGMEVAWDRAESRVNLEINETRAGLTPVELLVKSEQAAQAVNTYSMEGSFTIDMAMRAEDVEETVPSMVTTISGQVQNEPFQTYLIQTMEMPGMEESALEMETYMTEEKIYVKGPDGQWTVQDLPFGPEFWQEQRALQSDPLQAAAQLREMGMLLTFSDDTVIDGQDYYVVNGLLDMEKFREAYPEIMEQALGAVPLPAADLEQVQLLIQKLLENMNMDYFYRVYINQDTLMSDRVDCKIFMDLVLDLKELGEMDEEVLEGMPQQVELKMDMEGRFIIKDVGRPFEAPDVSQALSIEELMAPELQE